MVKMQGSDSHQLQELTVFFQKNSGKILKGRCNLALTTHTLAHLNQCFKQNDEDPLLESQSSSSDTPTDRTRPQMVKFLYSYVQRTPALKLVQPTSTLHGPVEISRFSSLTMLEIKKVPVHMLNGLGCLRNQLQVLICSRCVHSLQSLLCLCGGDMLAEAPWSSLHTLNLSYNHIDALDDSLRQLPTLKMLDLSHNDLRHTRDYLECLSELAHLNLGYNRLERVPSLGLVARTNLQTLVIRNNSLDNLGGLEDYSSLLELDLGNNCLYEGAELRTLGYLHKLREVNLLGNPLAYDPVYRSIVISKLPPEASSRKMYLDGLPLSSAENQKIPRISLSKPLLRIPSQSSIDTCNSNLFNEISSFDDSMDLTDSQVVSKGKKSKGKRASKKVRTVSISDQGTTKGNNSKAGNTKVLQDSDIEDTRRENEKKRQMYGRDWLQTLQAPYQQSATTSASESEKSVAKDLGKSRRARSDPPAPGSSGIGSDSDRNDIDGRDIDTVIDTVIDESKTNRHDIDKRDISLSITDTKKQDIDEIDIGKTYADITVHANGNAEEKIISRLDNPAASVNELIVEATIEKSEQNGAITQHEHLGAQMELILEKKDSKPSIFLERSESEMAFDSPWAETAPEEEEHELCSPLLVTVHDSVQGTDVHLFLTIKETHIEERDLNGRVVERLEINCLKSMQQSEESVWSEEIGGHHIVPVVKLAFDYIRRDRTRRRYILEDNESFQTLTKTLQPFLEENQQQAAAIQKGLFQCLKCSLEFSRDQAKRKLRTRHRGSLRGYNSDDEGNNDIESWMNEVPVCPACNSDLIVELESPLPNSNHTSTVNTPIGSLNSVEMNIKPMATSSPWKLRDKEALFVSSTEKSQSGSSTEYHSANDSLSSSPAQNLVTKPSLTSSSSGTSTLIDSCGKLASPKSSRQELISEETSGNEMSTLQSVNDGQSNVSNFVLPDPTIKLSRGDETNPLENMSTYQHEKLRELLQENIAPFSQKYSLVPTDILEDVVSKERLGRSNLSLEETADVSPTKEMSNSVGNDDEKNGNKSEIIPMRTKGGSTLLMSESKTLSNKGSYDYVRNMTSGPCSEDDIVIIPAEKANNGRHDAVDFNDSNNAVHDAPSYESTNVGRAGSTDSEIAVLRSMSIDAVSITSDCVFDSSLNAAPSNLANALSDAASRLEMGTSSKTSLESSCNLETSGKYSTSPADKIYSDTLATDTIAKTNVQTSVSKESSMTISFEASGSVAIPRKHSMIDIREGDFSNVDHRLKLYFSMSLFGSKEELACMTKCRIFQFSKSMNFAGLLVISTSNIYIMKITKEESEKPSNWLSKRTQHSIRDLLHVHIGPGSQSFQLDFNNEGVLYTIVMKDSEMCEAFAKCLVDAVRRGPMSKKCRFKDIVRDHPNTLMNIMSQVMGASMNGTSLERDMELRLYLLAYRKTLNEVTKGMAVHLSPISVLVTSNDLYLAEENHFWPLRQTKTKGLAKMTQFTLKEHQKITDVIEVELYEDTSTDVTIGFCNEDNEEQTQWHIQTENASSLVQLLNSIKRPWQEMFGVELKQIIHPTVSIQEDLLL